jgi:hypothetical protein
LGACVFQNSTSEEAVLFHRQSLTQSLAILSPPSDSPILDSVQARALRATDANIFKLRPKEPPVLTVSHSEPRSLVHMGA